MERLKKLVEKHNDLLLFDDCIYYQSIVYSISKAKKDVIKLARFYYLNQQYNECILLLESVGEKKSFIYIQCLKKLNKCDEQQQKISLNDGVESVITAELLRNHHTPEQILSQVDKNDILYDLLVLKFNKTLSNNLLSNSIDYHLIVLQQLHSTFNHKECYEYSAKLLPTYPSHAQLLTLHVNTLYELKLKNELYKLSHELQNNYAIAVYYMLLKNYASAKQYFTKCTDYSINSWIGYGHCFSFENEHDQCIAAYSTAAFKHKHTHVPYLYIAMEYLKIHQLSLTLEYLMLAKEMCPSDLLVLNELGVLYYHQQKFDIAKSYLLKAAKQTTGNNELTIAIYTNLGHSLRELGEFDKATLYFTKIAEMDTRNANALSALGLLCYHRKEFWRAIEYFHCALAVDDDEVVNDLLALTLEEHGKNEFFDMCLGGQKLPLCVPVELNVDLRMDMSFEH